MLRQVTRCPWLSRLAPVGLVAGVLTAGVSGDTAQNPVQNQAPPAFRSSVDFVPISVTVTDRNGRFVSDLKRENFRVYEDGREQSVVHFGAERVPVSLGLALDTSDSMKGQKLVEAQMALNRFLGELLGPNDEICLYRFADRPTLVQSWTSDRAQIRRALGEVRAGGGTALLDTVSEALPMVQNGQRLKKVLVVISDGRDTASNSHPDTVYSLIRATDVLIYAVGIDGRAKRTVVRTPTQSPPRMPVPRPFPIPGGRGRGGSGRGGVGGGGGTGGWPGPDPGTGTGAAWPPTSGPTTLPPTGGQGPVITVTDDERVDAGALRELTDTSGGRTEIVRSTADLGPATAGIADELNRQYLLGYQASAPHDGQWHDIKVEVRGRWGVTVRARKGYRASR